MVSLTASGRVLARGRGQDRFGTAILERMHQAADHFVQNMLIEWGPWALFLILVLAGVGLHLPEDLIVTPAGWEIAAGNLPLVGTIIAAWAGIALGDLLWFHLCRRYGWRLLDRRWFKKIAHPKRILQMKALFERHGWKVLVAARFIPGARTPSITVGGLVHMSPVAFLLVEIPSAAMSVGIQLGLGFAAERGLNTSGPLHWISIGVGVVITIIAVATGILVWRRMSAGRIRLPRARVSWLRHGTTPAPD